MNPLMGYQNFIPLLAPQDITTTATATPYMDLANCNAAGFLIFFGNVNSATTTNTELVTVEAATAPTGTEANVSYQYRLSGAVGANTWGAVTTIDATSTGLSIGVSDDNKAVYIELDLRTMGGSDLRYARVKLTDNDDMANCLVSVFGVIDPKYKQTTFHAATAAASG